MLELIDDLAVQMRELRRSLNLQLVGIIETVLSEGEKKPITSGLPASVVDRAEMAVEVYKSSALTAYRLAAGQMIGLMPSLANDEIAEASIERFSSFLERQSREDVAQAKGYVRKVSIIASLLRQKGYANHTSMIHARRSVKQPHFRTMDRKGRRYDSLESSYLAARRHLIDLHSTLIAIAAMREGKRYVYLGDKRISVNSLFADEKNLPHPRTEVLLRLQK